MELLRGTTQGAQLSHVLQGQGQLLTLLSLDFKVDVQDFLALLLADFFRLLDLIIQVRSLVVSAFSA